MIIFSIHSGGQYLQLFGDDVDHAPYDLIFGDEMTTMKNCDKMIKICSELQTIGFTFLCAHDMSYKYSTLLEMVID